MVSGDFEGQALLVTGAASGIGFALAELLVARGAQVVCADIDAPSVAAVAERLGPRAVPVSADITRPDDCRSMVESARDNFGSLSGAANCAGIFGTEHFKRLADISAADWARTMDVNLTGTFNCLQAQIPAVVEAGGGSIVNVSSVMGLVANPRAGAYVTSKHGIIGLTRAAAVDYAADGLRVNVVCPGFVDSPFIADATPERKESYAQRHLRQQLLDSEEIAEVIAFLLSPRSSAVTGACYAADGGYTVQ